MDTEAAAEPSPPEKLPDGGCLPDWKTDELPAPKPLHWRLLLSMVGPGLVLAGGSIGTGEWVMGPVTAFKYHGALLWVVPLSILCQALINTEAMRYTLVTGEPIFTGFLRSRPGPRFWLLWYLAFDCVVWWPAFAGLASQILLFTVTGETPTDSATRILSCAILAACFLLLCFGGKVYNTLEWVLGAKVVLVLAYLAFLCFFFVPLHTWGDVVGGMVNPMRLPPGGKIDWGLVAALAGYAGIGGMSNILASNYVREKGWGMGCKVGAIGSAFGGHCLSLSHIGTRCPPTAEAQSRFRVWWKYIQIDQYGVWVWASIIGMLLPCLLGAAFLTGDYTKGASELNTASRLAIDIGASKGEVFMKLTLLCGFIITFPGQLASMDGVARRWCDALWSGSRRVRAMDTHNIRYVYYAFVGAYTLLGFFLTGVARPATMMKIAANLANLVLSSCILHTLYVNLRFLPPEFRPPLLKRIGMVLAAVFFLTMFGLMAWETLPGLLNAR